MITGDITVARLLDEHPDLIEVLASYHPHFKQLRNRLLRRVMAPRVTVAQAARMAGVRLPTERSVLVRECLASRHGEMMGAVMRASREQPDEAKAPQPGHGLGIVRRLCRHGEAHPAGD
jgi:hypothetical protein